MSTSQPRHFPHQASPHPPPGEIPPRVQKHADPPDAANNHIIPPLQTNIIIIILLPIPSTSPLLPSPKMYYRPPDALLDDHGDAVVDKEPRFSKRAVPPAHDGVRREAVHKGAAHEPAEHLAHIRLFRGALARDFALDPFARPDAVDEEEAGEETMPAVAPEISDVLEVPDTRGVEGWEVREWVWCQGRQHDCEGAVAQGEYGHQKGTQCGSQGQLQAPW